MVALFFFLLLVYVALGIVGFVVHGLLWLFVLVAVLFVATLLLAGFRAGKTRERNRF